MREEKIAKVVKFFAKPSVAAIAMTDGSLGIGDRMIDRMVEKMWLRMNQAI